MFVHQEETVVRVAALISRSILRIAAAAVMPVRLARGVLQENVINNFIDCRMT